MLAHAGAAVDADDLVREVYVEGLRGSLQPELLGATRRHGFIPYVLAPDAGALVAELAAAPARARAAEPRVGARARVALRRRRRRGRRRRDPALRHASSGASSAAHVSCALGSAARTGHSWRVEPGELPATATAGAYVRALAGAEPLLGAAAAERGYRAALERWPSDELVLFAAAGHRHARRRPRRRYGALPPAPCAAPQHAAARNNLANVLAARGCHAEALAEARAALAAIAPTDELGAAVRDTVAELEQRGRPEPRARGELR